MKETKQFLLVLDAELHKKLKAFAEKKRMKMRDVIRKAIQLILDLEED